MSARGRTWPPFGRLSPGMGGGGLVEAEEHARRGLSPIRPWPRVPSRESAPAAGVLPLPCAILWVRIGFGGSMASRFTSFERGRRTRPSNRTDTEAAARCWARDGEPSQKGGGGGLDLKRHPAQQGGPLPPPSVSAQACAWGARKGPWGSVGVRGHGSVGCQRSVRTLPPYMPKPERHGRARRPSRTLLYGPSGGRERRRRAGAACGPALEGRSGPFKRTGTSIDTAASMWDALGRERRRGRGGMGPRAPLGGLLHSGYGNRRRCPNRSGPYQSIKNQLPKSFDPFFIRSGSRAYIDSFRAKIEINHGEPFNCSPIRQVAITPINSTAGHSASHCA